MNLDALSQMLGSPEMASRFIQLFKNQTPAQLVDLQRFANENDWQNVSITAHALKGQLAYLSAENERAAAYQLEQDAENGQATVGQVHNFIQNIGQLMERLP